ncbi:MAG TPA: hypothetical protein VFW00_06120, partial [Rhodocyclaceae bacterium]|nr:hypothetical protein [Rhodocyclaceae bacterium]
MKDMPKSIIRWLSYAASCCLFATTRVSAQTTLEPEIARIPLNGVDIVTLIYKPSGTGPFPIVIFSHGRAGSDEERAKLQIPLNGHVQYWLGKGFALVAPVRIGYGQTGGPDREDSGTRWHSNTCTTKPDFDKVATNAAQSVTTVMDWLKKQSWADNRRLVLEGQSVGGMTTVKLGSMGLPGVLGYINFAGGSGGNPERSPTKSCHPEIMTETYRAYGTQTHVPSIWFYAENDQYWGPDMPSAWHAAFSEG